MAVSDLNTAIRNARRGIDEREGIAMTNNERLALSLWALIAAVMLLAAIWQLVFDVL